MKNRRNEMFIGRVIGVIVSTSKEESLRGHKLLIVQDISEKGTKKSLIALDSVGAGMGETVLVVHDGGAARQAVRSKDAPINAAIVGIVDHPEQFE
ncbi:MAG TPA: EutN/CcmL family microcompartment protein [Clostridia bacterium]|nr:EutN/CcmL family microcompartment protein [Clostridia bacterium]